MREIEIELFRAVGAVKYPILGQRDMEGDRAARRLYGQEMLT